MSNASEYADSIAAGIRARIDAGAPFGWIDRNGYGWSEDPADLESPTEASAMDYLSDVLDIQYLVNSDRSYRAARVLIAFGGPTAWIDTHSSQLEVAWWSEPEFRELPQEFIDGLDDALSELWEMGA